MRYILTILIVFYLIIDNPFLEFKMYLNKIFIKSLKILIAILIFLNIYYLLNSPAGLSNELISWALLSGLIIVYIISGEHSGIEDKIARKVFKIIAWFFLWIILLFHLFFI